MGEWEVAEVEAATTAAAEAALEGGLGVVAGVMLGGYQGTNMGGICSTLSTIYVQDILSL